MLITSHAALGKTGLSTGAGLQTVVGPYYLFRDAGLSVDFASVAGGSPPIDPLSLGDDVVTSSMLRFEDDEAAQRELSQSMALREIDEASYAAIFVAGGHGGMWDFPDNPTVAKTVMSAIRTGIPLAAVCHGVAALCSADPQTGKALAHGRRLTGLSNQEERLLGRDDAVPFLLEDRLRAAGAAYVRAAPFATNVVADGRLVTGQNMRSADAAAQQLLRLLHRHPAGHGTALPDLLDLAKRGPDTVAGPSIADSIAGSS